MRIIDLDFYADKGGAIFLGYAGEHLSTVLNFHMPAELGNNDCIYVINFLKDGESSSNVVSHFAYKTKFNTNIVEYYIPSSIMGSNTSSGVFQLVAYGITTTIGNEVKYSILGKSTEFHYVIDNAITTDTSDLTIELSESESLALQDLIEAISRLGNIETQFNELDGLTNALGTFIEKGDIAYTLDSTTTNVTYNATNPKIIYTNAYVNGKNAFVLTTANNYYQIALCYDGTEYKRELTAGGSTTYKPWVLVNNENTGNKKATLTGNESSNDFYPTTKAVADALSTKAPASTAYTFDTTTTNVVYNVANPKTIYLNATVDGEAGIVITAKDNGFQYFFGRNSTIKIRHLTGGTSYSNWAQVTEHVDNKKNSITASNRTSTDYYPSIKAVVDYLVANYENLSNKLTSEEGIDSDSTDTQYPTAKAVHDLGVEILGLVNDDISNVESRLVLKESASNKQSSITAVNKESTTQYPSIKAVYDYGSQISSAVELCESDVVRTIGHINTRVSRFTPSLINDGVNINYANCTVSLDNDIFTFTSTKNAEIYFGNQVNTGGMYQSRFGTKIDVVGVDKLELVISNNAFNKNYVSYFDTNNTCVGNTKFTTTPFFSLVPENAEYCVIRIGIDSTTIGAEYQTTLKVYDVGKVPLDEEINRLKDTQEKLINRFDDGIVNIPEFETGNWQARVDGYIYQDSTTRIRSKMGSTVHLYVGDWVKITGPIRVYYGIYSDNTYSSVGWKNTDYIVTKEGDYQFLITAVPEATVINAEDLAKYFTVYRHESVPRNLVDIQNGRLTQVISCNHRGYNSVAPENTLPAYKRSAIEGFNYVETDVSVTSDGVYVLLHDDTINRTARNADGTEISEDVYINQITYAQALEYDFGIWKSQDYAGTKIPTFEQFIQLCRGLGLHPYIEIKRSNNFTEQQIHDLVDIVRDNGMINDVTWIEFSSGYSDLRTLVDYAPESRIGLVGSTPSVELVAKAKSLCTGQNEVFFNASVYDVTEENATICANAGIRLETWDSGNRSRFDDIYPYVKGFTTNTYIASRKLYDVYSV